MGATGATAGMAPRAMAMAVHMVPVHMVPVHMAPVMVVHTPATAMATHLVATVLMVAMADMAQAMALAMGLAMGMDTHMVDTALGTMAVGTAMDTDTKLSCQWSSGLGMNANAHDHTSKWPCS